MNKEWWNFSCFKMFENKVYKTSLSSENLLNNGHEMFFETIFNIEDQELHETMITPPENRNVVLLCKGSEKYILPAKWLCSMPLKPLKSFKCQVKKSDKTVYNFITQPSEMRIGAEKGGTFKEFITAWNPMNHTSPKDWIFMKIVSIASKYKGTKICLCSEPTFGKNSNFSIMNCISEDICRIQKPQL